MRNESVFEHKVVLNTGIVLRFEIVYCYSGTGFVTLYFCLKECKTKEEDSAMMR